MPKRATTAGEPTGPDALAPYRRKRDFARTPEPSGSPSGDRPAGAPRFVVQRHRARRLHYDFRLEIDGVLVSWAVPKGPTLDPEVRRAAFHVEDHPIEYFDFEGVIPAGEYGGGDVIVWDAGTWEPHEAGDPPDPAAAVDAGELHLDMYGEKLRGRFVLVRTRRSDVRARRSGCCCTSTTSSPSTAGTPRTIPRSVLSGRTNDEVKADPDRLWRSDLPAAGAAVALKPHAVDGRARTSWRELDALPVGRARGTSSAASCGSPTSTRCCSRRRPARSR